MKFAETNTYGAPIPRLDYTEEERATWEYCVTRLEKLHKKNACKEYNEIVDEFRREINFSSKEIPQLEDIS